MFLFHMCFYSKRALIPSVLLFQRPLALAKIVGIYTLGYRNAKTGSSKRIDVIVMENLLYGRKSAKVGQSSFYMAVLCSCM